MGSQLSDSGRSFWFHPKKLSELAKARPGSKRPRVLRTRGGHAAGKGSQQGQMALQQGPPDEPTVSPLGGSPPVPPSSVSFHTWEPIQVWVEFGIASREDYRTYEVAATGEDHGDITGQGIYTPGTDDCMYTSPLLWSSMGGILETTKGDLSLLLP